MKFLLKVFFLALAFILIHLWAGAQGCSDAGFCTMGAMKPDQKFIKSMDVKLRSIELSHYIGRTKFDDYVMATTLDFNIGIGKKNTFQFKVPYMVILSTLGNMNGLGDFSLSFSRNLLLTEKYQINATIGTKIPSNRANQLTREGRTISMYQQPSLGTFDFIAGASFISRNWLIAVGYQQPLTDNGNQFNPILQADNPRLEPGNPKKAYPNGTNLRRRADVMLRVERNFRFSNLNFHIGLLNIHRFREDEVTATNGNRVAIPNSNGSALSFIVGTTYHFNTQSAIKLIFGDRWLQRERNPDGLSREQVYTVGYQLSF
ncbi:MAG: hypothetical protein MUE85_10490 [Microscillaceae bacterium]|jgi:hypothetical protein|nr:hypothetical protein [Microscillaceae bacterium]